MSETIQLFSDDHTHALEMLEKLHGDIEKLKRDEDLISVKEGLSEFVDFLEHALKVHFRQEEEALFPVMIKADIRAKEPIEAMLEEHKIIETAHRSLKEELLGDKPSPEVIIENGEKIVEVLTGHINREDHALFPFAMRILEKGLLDEVDERRRKMTDSV